jgi:hypothetical protein
VFDRIDQLTALTESPQAVTFSVVARIRIESADGADTLKLPVEWITSVDFDVNGNLVTPRELEAPSSTIDASVATTVDRRVTVGPFEPTVDALRVTGAVLAAASVVLLGAALLARRDRVDPLDELDDITVVVSTCPDLSAAIELEARTDFVRLAREVGVALESRSSGERLLLTRHTEQLFVHRPDGRMASGVVAETSSSEPSVPARELDRHVMSSEHEQVVIQANADLVDERRDDVAAVPTIVDVVITEGLVEPDEAEELPASGGEVAPVDDSTVADRRVDTETRAMVDGVIRRVFDRLSSIEASPSESVSDEADEPESLVAALSSTVDDSTLTQLDDERVAATGRSHLIPPPPASLGTFVVESGPVSSDWAPPTSVN